MTIDEMTGRVALALGLLGPAVIGLIAPVISLLRFRAAHARPSVLAAAGALVVWLALCVGSSMLFVQMAFGYAWGWAHVRRPVSFSERLTPLVIFTVGLIVLSGCAAGLHRLIRRPSHVSTATPPG
jgi:hypothetical protein